MEKLDTHQTNWTHSPLLDGETKTPTPFLEEHGNFQRARIKLPRNPDGSLDVTPNGIYIAITERNYNKSPLLHLPPEIRNQIFGLVVGGKSIEPSWKSTKAITITVKGRSPGKENPFALLQVCRQAYAETALLPFTLNDWHYRILCVAQGVSGSKSRINEKLWPREYQWEAISTVTIRQSYEIYASISAISNALAKLPKLKRLVFQTSYDRKTSQPYVQRSIERLRAGVAECVELTVEKQRYRK